MKTFEQSINKHQLETAANMREKNSNGKNAIETIKQRNKGVTIISSFKEHSLFSFSARATISISFVREVHFLVREAFFWKGGSSINM
jgi:hypothetical protein